LETAWLDNAGFGKDDIIVATYEYGSIKLQKLEPKRFCFPEIASPGN